MSNTSFKFNTAQYTAIKDACKKLRKQTNVLAYGEDSVLVGASEHYKRSVRDAILKGSFPVSYRPLSRKYSEWKARVAPSLGLPAFWQLSSSTIRNLKVVKARKGVVLSGLMVSRVRQKERYGASGRTFIRQTPATDYTVMVNNIRPLFAPMFRQEYTKLTSKIQNRWLTQLYWIWK